MNICIFGDSITYGAYDPINGGWATLLRNHVEKKYNDTDTYSLGICGDTSSGLIERFPLETKARSPEIIIFAIGTNDSLFRQSPDGQKLDTDQFTKNINSLISLANKYTEKMG